MSGRAAIVPGARSEANPPPSGPMLEFARARMRPPPSSSDRFAAANTTRANGNVQLLDAMVLDYDGKTGSPPDIEGIALVWAGVGLEFVLHTSYSHTEQAPRLRVILPYYRPATPAEHTATWLWAQQVSGGYQVDPACKDAARIYYVPCHAEGTTPTLLHWPGSKLVPKA